MWELKHFIQLFRETVTDLQKTEYELELQRQDMATGLNETLINVSLRSVAFRLLLV